MVLGKLYKKATEEWLLKKSHYQSNLIMMISQRFFIFLNILLQEKHQRKELLLPCFDKTDTVIFSDYGGDS